MERYYLCDYSNPKDIELYAKALVNMTFEQVLSKYGDSSISEAYNKRQYKGGLGNLVQEEFFGIKANNLSEPDFKVAGVELKVSPFEEKKDKTLRAGERLVLTMISFSGPIEKDLYKSHLWIKCRLLLLIYYLRDKAQPSNLDYQIKYVSLFTPPEEDLSVIERDYQTITDKISKGRAHELSESDTLYLGACTKGVNAEKSLIKQYYSVDTEAKKRAFCYKNSYMTFVLNKYIIKGIETYEPIVKDSNLLKEKSLEEIVENKLSRYIGKTDQELCKKFSREYNNNKLQWVDLTYKMLGIKSNRAEEFVKADIVVKVIRIEENGAMKESMSFPPFKYKELIKEKWEDSTLHNYFEETKFLFVVFKRSGMNYTLKGCQFWNMPWVDLEDTVRLGWENVVQVIKQGVVFTRVPKADGGVIVKNNLPKKGDNLIVHVRPHSSKRYYKFENGEEIGNGNPSHSNQLPDGRWMPNYSYWINNSYILGQLSDKLVK